MFYKYLNCKNSTHVILLLNGAEKLVTKDMEKDEILNALFTSVFTS